MDFLTQLWDNFRYLCERGRFDRSKKLIAVIHDEYGRMIQGTVRVPLFLADIYTVQLFYHSETTTGESLVTLARKALDIRERAFREGEIDEFHPNRANGYMNVGVFLLDQDPLEAIKFQSMALKIRLGSAKFAKDQIHGLALNYLNIGRCWSMVGDQQSAASSFNDCVSLMKQREVEVGKNFPLLVQPVFVS